MVEGPLAAAAHDEEVAVAHFDRERASTTSGSEGQAAGRSDRDDGDDGVMVSPSPDPITVPGDRIVSVSVEAASGGHERFAEFLAISPVEGVTGSFEGWMRQSLPRPVLVLQPGHVDVAVVHASSTRTPWDPVEQCIEDGIGFRQPGSGDVEPGPRPQGTALEQV